MDPKFSHLKLIWVLLVNTEKKRLETLSNLVKSTTSTSCNKLLNLILMKFKLKSLCNQRTLKLQMLLYKLNQRKRLNLRNSLSIGVSWSQVLLLDTASSLLINSIEKLNSYKTWTLFWRIKRLKLPWVRNKALRFWRTSTLTKTRRMNLIQRVMIHLPVSKRKRLNM